MRPDGNDTDVSQLASDILQHCRNHLASYKVPKHCQFVDQLPRNPSGKILKRELREFKLASHNSSADAQTSTNQTSELVASLPDRSTPLRAPTLLAELGRTYANNRNEVATEFIRNLVQVLSGEETKLEPDSRFLEAGLDSLMIVEMSSQIQAEVGTNLEIPATLLFDYPRVCDLAEFLVSTFESNDDRNEESSRPDASSDAEPDLRQQIEAMSEAEALDELMRELETS